MSLDKTEKIREKREWNRFFYGVALGTILGIIGNLWVSFFMKVIEEYNIQLEPRVWLTWFFLISVILFCYGIGLAFAFGKGLRFQFGSSKKTDPKR